MIKSRKMINVNNSPWDLTTVERLILEYLNFNDFINIYNLDRLIEYLDYKNKVRYSKKELLSFIKSMTKNKLLIKKSNKYLTS